MVLHYYGLSCFRLQGNSSDVSVLIDPFDQSSGWKMPRVSADITLFSQPAVPSSAPKAKDGTSSFVIHYPGEYEVKNVFVYCLNAPKKTEQKKGQAENTNLFIIGIDDVYIGHLGTLDRTLTEKELDALDRIDILLLPVGIGGAGNPKTALEIITQIEPRIVVPMMYRQPGLKGDLSPLDNFLKEYGVKDGEQEEKLKVMKKDLPSDETKVRILKPV